MKSSIFKFFLQFLFIFCINSQELSEPNIEYINSLPDEIREDVLSRFQNQELNSSSNEPEMIQDSVIEVKEEEPSQIFGIDFFKKEPLTNAPVTDIPLGSNYSISSGDRIGISLIGNKIANYELTVSLNGTLLIPELGQVFVRGLSIEEANLKIDNMVKDAYVGSSSYLSIIQPALRKISVVGAVSNPGTLLVNPFVTVSEAIKYAGGFQEIASLRSVQVISSDGDTIREIDFYKFLVGGNREDDITLNNGDTVKVLAAKNHVDISGAVNRPMKYEFISGDKVSSLIEFALGFSQNADLQRIFINAQNQGEILTRKVDYQETLDLNLIKSLYVSSNYTFSNEQIFIAGKSVTDGYYDYNLGDDLKNLIEEKIKFSDTIYPFFFLFQQTSKNGSKNEIQNLSLFDPDTYEALKLDHNVKITFFSREDIEIYNENQKKFLEIEDKIKELEDELEERFETQSQILQSQYTFSTNKIRELNDDLQTLEEERSTSDIIFQLIPKNRLISINYGDELFFLPAAGKVTIADLYKYSPTSALLDFERAYANTSQGLRENSYYENLNSDDLLSINIPTKAQSLVSVVIEGDILFPGEYKLEKASTLQELYEIAGGFTDFANGSGVVLSRESIKEKELRAYRAAKDLVVDAIVNTLANPTGIAGTEIDPALLSFFNNKSKDDFVGRLTGDLGYNSITASNTFLEEGDYIFVPKAQNILMVQGEVLNQITLKFQDSYTLGDYVNSAGGYTKFADKKNVYVITSAGLSVKLNSSGLLSSDYVFQPGDTIVVPRRLGNLPIGPLVSTISSVLSNIAFSAASLNSIRN